MLGFVQAADKPEHRILDFKNGTFYRSDRWGFYHLQVWQLRTSNERFSLYYLNLASNESGAMGMTFSCANASRRGTEGQATCERVAHCLI